VKLFLYILVGFVALALAALLITWGHAPASNPLIMFGFIALFAIPPFGAFWMMYQVIRYEKQPFPLVLLAVFIPFAFLWYYFERTRPRRLAAGDRQLSS
jgi:hypothetical protein